MNKRKVRDSNYELLRVIAMFSIVLWHVITKSQIDIRTTGSVHFILNAIEMLLMFHVNTFMLITGYYQCKSKFNLKKLLSLILQIAFFNFFINTFLKLSGLVEYSTLEYWRSIMFFNIDSYWYIKCYFIVYLLSPFFNKFIDQIDKTTFKKLNIVLLTCYVILPFFSRGLVYWTDGFAVSQYVLMYFIGAYIRKYDLNIHFLERLNLEQKRVTYFLVFVFSGIIGVMMNYFGNFLMTLDNSILSDIGSYIAIYKLYYSNPLVVIQSISLFMLFGTFKMKSKVIDKLASLTLGIYIIHETSAVRDHIYQLLVVEPGKSVIYGKSIILTAFLAAFVIFFGSALIEAMRQLLFKLLSKLKSVRKLENKTLSFINAIIDIK